METTLVRGGTYHQDTVSCNKQRQAKAIKIEDGVFSAHRNDEHQVEQEYPDHCGVNGVAIESGGAAENG